MSKSLSKTAISRLMFVSLLVGILLFSFGIELTRTKSDNVLVNGDFETGTLDGWNVIGVCAISDAVVYNGSYSAYVSDVALNNHVHQYLYQPIDSSLGLEAWVNPLKTGSLGFAEYPLSGFVAVFFYESTMTLAFVIYYAWSWCEGLANSTESLVFWLPFETGVWTLISRNMTSDAYSYFTSMNFSDIFLQRIGAAYHYSETSPGPFYLDGVKVTSRTPPAIMISSVTHTPEVPNYDEEVHVSAVVEPVENVSVVILSYDAGGGWENITMSQGVDAFHADIPSQPYNTLVQYRVISQDTAGIRVGTTAYQYRVEDSVSPELSVTFFPAWPSANSTTTVTIIAAEPLNASDIGGIEVYFIDYVGQTWRMHNFQTAESWDSNEHKLMWLIILPLQPYEGTMSINITVTDNVGNQAEETYNFTINFPVIYDITGPNGVPDGEVDMRDVGLVARHYGEHV